MEDDEVFDKLHSFGNLIVLAQEKFPDVLSTIVIAVLSYNYMSCKEEIDRDNFNKFIDTIFELIKEEMGK